MLNKEKHRQIMYNVLIDIFSSNISKYLAFKWWTACYFLYSLDRFSTDLDLDLILENENIDEKIIKILKKYWDVKTWKYDIKLSYWIDDVNIKIDINRNIWNNNEYEVVNFYWTDIKVQKKSTIFANKLVALVERIANRDIYDVYFFFKNSFDINENIIIERTWKSKKDLFIEVVNILKKLWKNYKILDWLWEVLNNEKHKSFVKDKLLIELIWRLEFEINMS